MQQSITADAQLLSYVCQNAAMGKETIQHLEKIVEDKSFLKVIKSQEKEYQSIYDEAKEKLEEVKGKPERIGALEQASVYFMIEAKTLLNKTPSHLAEMMIQGSTMGIVDIVKKKKEYYGAERQSLCLAERLLKHEQDNVEEMKKFLS